MRGAPGRPKLTPEAGQHWAASPPARPGPSLPAPGGLTGRWTDTNALVCAALLKEAEPRRREGSCQVPLGYQCPSRRAAAGGRTRLRRCSHSRFKVAPDGKTAGQAGRRVRRCGLGSALFIAHSAVRSQQAVSPLARPLPPAARKLRAGRHLTVGTGAVPGRRRVAGHAQTRTTRVRRSRASRRGFGGRLCEQRHAPRLLGPAPVVHRDTGRVGDRWRKVLERERRSGQSVGDVASEAQDPAQHEVRGGGSPQRVPACVAADESPAARPWGAHLVVCTSGTGLRHQSSRTLSVWCFARPVRQPLAVSRSAAKVASRREQFSYLAGSAKSA